MTIFSTNFRTSPFLMKMEVKIKKNVNRFIDILAKCQALGIFIVISLFLSRYAYAENSDSWKNFYAIGWRDTEKNHLIYAKQMGYEHIAIKSSDAKTYFNDPNSNGLRFYFTDPKNRGPSMFGYDTTIDETKVYTESEKKFYNDNMVWKSNEPFPKNLATGWFFGGPTKYEVLWDFQQQRVIDKVVEGIINMAAYHEKSETNFTFTFGGYMDDEPNLGGSFYVWDESKEKGNSLVSLRVLTGLETDTGLKHGDISHEYPTYQQGKAAFYKQLRKRAREEFPSNNVKWIVEPYNIYGGWIEGIKDLPDNSLLVPDFISQESGRKTFDNGFSITGTEFVDDARIFSAGLGITKDMMGTTQPNRVDKADNCLYAAKAGINGAWYNWFGRYGGTGQMPDFQKIEEVYPRLKLVRVIPNWDNLNNVPLSGRSWDGSVYRSSLNGQPQSYIDINLMYSRHWKTGKLFAVFNNANSRIQLKAGETLISAHRVDGFFREAGSDVKASDFSISGSQISLARGLTATEQEEGVGYIFTVGGDTTAPAAPTGLRVQ